MNDLPERPHVIINLTKSSSKDGGEGWSITVDEKGDDDSIEGALANAAIVRAAVIQIQSPQPTAKALEDSLAAELWRAFYTAWDDQADVALSYALVQRWRAGLDFKQ